MSPAELRAWRESHGLTRPQLAALLSVPGRKVAPQTIYQWETETEHHSDPPPYLWRALRDIETYG